MAGRLPDFQRFADYNAWANARLYDAVETLSPEALRAERPAAFFHSILGTLNHLLVADRIWLDRFQHLPPAHSRLDEIVHDDLAALRAARVSEDARIRRFVDDLAEADLDARLAYKTSSGSPKSDPLGALLSHVFNHQTHHRGQAHALIQEAGVAPPPLDLIYYMRETG
ncbi:MAG: DinB family protein [Rhodovibrio sp.]|nr:DinB family protein [Rhodovibrio sp.]